METVAKEWLDYKTIQRDAHKKVEYALRKARMVRPFACEVCNKIGKPKAHHNDYSKPYDVVWLCHDCHTKEHKSPFIGRGFERPPLPRKYV